MPQRFKVLKDCADANLKAAYRSVVKEAIASICDTNPEDLRHPIDEVVIKCVENLSLWRCLDIDDFSKTRFFVVPESAQAGLAVFEVDFLGRHEIVPPLKKESLPESWKEWGVVVGDSIHVFDREAFIKTLLTPEIFLALPEHRFATLADCVWGRLCDMSDHSEDPDSVHQAIFDVLTDKRDGYSFLLFLLDNENEISYRDPITLYWVQSCLEGKKYERIDRRRLASEQLELRPL